MLVTLTVVALVLDAVDGWIVAAHGHGVAAGRAVRRRGRRVPDPRPQRVRRPLGRRVGARDRRGALRVPRGRVAAAVDARAAAAALLAQGRRGDAGDHAGDRGCGRPAAGRDPGRPARRARAARRVVRPRRRVAVDPPAMPRTLAWRRLRTRDGRGARARTATRAVRTGIAAVLTVLAAAGRVGRPRRCRTSWAASRPGAFVRLPLEGLVVVALALVLPAPTRRLLACVVGPVLGLLRDREGPRHGVLRGLRPAVRPRRRRELHRHRHRDAARLDRPDARRTWPSPARRCSASAVLVLTTLAVLRLTRVAAGHRRWSLPAVTALGVVWVLCWAFGAQFVSYAPIASTSAAGLVVPRGPRGAGRRRGPRGLRRRDPPRPLPQHARRPAAGRPARQGRPARVRRELREGRGPGLLVLAAGRRRARPGDAALQAAGFSSRSAFLTSSTFGGLSWLAHSTMQSGVWVDNQLRYDQLVKTQPLDAQRGVQAGRLADRRRRAVEQPGLAGGLVVLPLRQALRPAERRLSRPEVLVRIHARPVRPPGAATPRAREDRPPSALRGGRPGVEPHAVDAHPAADRLERRRRRLDLQQHAGRRADARRALRRPRAGARGVRPVHRVHDERAGLLRAALRRRQPRARRPGRPSALEDHHRGEPESRRADLGHRPRPGGARPDRRVGLAERPAARPGRRRSGRWTPSATASSARSARSPRPEARRLTPPTAGGRACARPGAPSSPGSGRSRRTGARPSAPAR